ncbi:MAG TPA: cytochrome c peroxidase [Gammaproteobacteria bacterium]
MKKLDLLLFGISAVTVGAVVLTAMVRHDLAHQGGLSRVGQWLLATALGTGVLAFAVKLLLIITLLNFAHPTPFPSSAPSSQQPHELSYRATEPARFVWEPLDERKPLPSRSLATQSQHFVWEALPFEAPHPKSNATTADKVALGERLFFDRSLSHDRTLACSSCHDVRGGSGADNRATARGIGGQVGKRNSPTVWNAAFQSVLFWDGRAASLEEQAKGPLVNPLEMGMPSLTAVEARVRDNPAYRAEFARVFGDTRITIEQIAAAIAAYERTLITPDTPYDRFVRGDLTALKPAQLRGMGLFQSVGCVNCHSGPNFSAASLFEQKAALRIFPAHPTPFETRYRLTRDSGAAASGSERGIWRIPSLRNVALTAPYFHNGAVDNLDEAVRIMAAAELGWSGQFLVWSDRDKILTERASPQLTDQEVRDIVAFLHALTSDSLSQHMRQARMHRTPEVRYAYARH